MLKNVALATLLTAGLSTSLAACGSDSSTTNSSTPGSTSAASNDSTPASDSSAPAADAKPLKVVASFYPIQYAVQQIGGGHVDVSSLTPPGAEPHDLELTPGAVKSLTQADLLVYTKGFQASVDKASSNAPKTLDLAPTANLNLSLDKVTTVGEHDHDHGGGGDHDHDHEGGTDPHFWLDPTRMKAVGDAVAAELAKIDPDHKADYEKNKTAFDTSITGLDQKFANGLKTCKSRTIVTGHTAFGYLAERYKLTQVGVSGVDPEQEPTPERLKDVAAYVKKNHVTTIYTETLVSPAIAETVAKSTGAKTAVLDPIEGVTKDSKGTNYVEIMDSNLTALKTGLGCS